MQIVKDFLIFIVILISVFALLAFLGIGVKEEDEALIGNYRINQDEYMKNLELTSSVLEEGGVIPAQYTCDGEETNPPLEWSSVPDETVSLVLIMDDPDAVKPAGKVWDHWVVFNIDPATTEVLEGVEPDGVAGINSRGDLGYQGPCPPDGEHTYVFKLFALDTKLDLSEGATKKQVENAMEGYILAEAQLKGTYNRQ